MLYEIWRLYDYSPGVADFLCEIEADSEDIAVALATSTWVVGDGERLDAIEIPADSPIELR